MEEEINPKEDIKQEILSMKEVDLGILEAYKEMPKEFQENLSFTDFYNFHRKRIQDIFSRQESEEIVESLMGTSDKIEEKIPEEELCKKCSKERKAFDDKDFCIKCRNELREDAQNKESEIKEALLKDTNFIKLTSETAASAYVKQKYHDFKIMNKFIALKAIAKEAYQLKKMQN
jgi:hypothetical protein